VARELFAREHGREPRDARELAGAVTRYSRPRRTTVAGYDLTFSPVKSVSTLWAVAPREVTAVIEAAHDAAVADALTFLEQQVLFTRQGKDGARQVETRGMVAAAFTHRDSRAGDPDLHTHVAVANKVQTLDGTWLAIYGRVLHQHVVAASETYNTALERHLAVKLGIRFSPRPDHPGAAVDRRGVREIDGVDPALCGRWSRRRADITTRQDQLSRQFQSAHGRPPTPLEQIAVAQQANLETRDQKHEPRSLSRQRATWRAEAVEVLGSAAALDAMVTTSLHPPLAALAAGTQVSPASVEQAARQVIGQVESRRATWQVWHLHAEAHRQVRDLNLDIHPDDITAVVAQVVDTAAHHLSVNLTPNLDPLTAPTPSPAGLAEPAVLRRSDGSSVYRHTGADHYSSTRILHVEQRITTAAGLVGGAAVAHDDIDLSLLEARLDGTTLNAGQRQLVHAMAGSGRRVQLALAPAGTGKTTAVRVLASAWAEHVGPVIGLAPSAAAAAVLADATGIPCDTLAKLVHHLDHHLDQPSQHTDQPSATGMDQHRPGVTGAIGPQTLVVVDEAGMADTLTLDRVITHALERGASVRLLGDDQQLAAVGAGGVLRDIATSHGATRLEQVVRFTHPAEAPASLALRAGDSSALGFYLDHDRVHVDDLTTTLDTVLTAWTRDRTAGRDSLMLAPTHDLVTALNTRARTTRLTADALTVAGGGIPQREVALSHGTHASVGDTIITRRNDRRLRVGRTDWVKNGDRWTITDTGTTGAVSVTNLHSGQRTTLPAGYVAAHVQLGYATTVHTAQGLTADTVHGIITGTETRQLLYTMLTRGRHENHAHVVLTANDVAHVADHAAGHGYGPQPPLPPTTATAAPRTATELLEQVIARDGAALSASTTRAHATDPAPQLLHAASRYDDAVLAAAETHLGPAWATHLETTAEHLRPGLTHAPAWPTLRTHLTLAQADGRHALPALTRAATARGLEDADDPAAVLLWRLDHDRPDTPAGPLPWLPAIPHHLTDDQTWGPYLTARAQRVTTLASHLRDQARRTAPGPDLAAPPAAAPAPVDELAPPQATLDQPWAQRISRLLTPDLLADLTVWRAAHGLPDDPRRPAGPPPSQPGPATTYWRRLIGRLNTSQSEQIRHWERVIIAHVGHRDDYTAELAHRLHQLHHIGTDIPATLTRAAALGPLPDDHATATLAYRIIVEVTNAPDTADTDATSTATSVPRQTKRPRHPGDLHPTAAPAPPGPSR